MYNIHYIVSIDEKEMWQAVVMIVGAVLASRNESCHLYHHLFKPNSIEYIPGATVSGTYCSSTQVGNTFNFCKLFP